MGSATPLRCIHPLSFTLASIKGRSRSLIPLFKYTYWHCSNKLKRITRTQIQNHTVSNGSTVLCLHHSNIGICGPVIGYFMGAVEGNQPDLHLVPKFQDCTITPVVIEHLLLSSSPCLSPLCKVPRVTQALPQLSGSPCCQQIPD